MDTEQLDRLIAEKQTWARDEHYEWLTPEEFGSYIRKDPKSAFYFAGDKLTDRQFDIFCRLHPRSALCCRRELSPEQLDYCSEKEPWLALEMHCWGNPGLNLTKTQILSCCRNSPSAALVFVTYSMDDRLFKKCARAEPAVAMKHAADRLDPALFTECVRAAPLAALKFPAGLMDDELLKECARAEPAAALQYSFDRLDPVLVTE